MITETMVTSPSKRGANMVQIQSKQSQNFATDPGVFNDEGTITRYKRKKKNKKNIAKEFSTNNHNKSDNLYCKYEYQLQSSHSNRSNIESHRVYYNQQYPGEPFRHLYLSCIEPITGSGSNQKVGQVFMPLKSQHPSSQSRTYLPSNLG